MKYTKQYIEKLGEETNFINSNLEKVVRLLDVLDYIFTKSSFSKFGLMVDLQKIQRFFVL